MKKFFIGYIGFGLLLVITSVLLSVRGMSDHDLELIEEAVELNREYFWPGFDFGEYPVAIRDGEKEFVYEDGIVTKRRPVLPVIAATAYKVDGRVNVFMPSFDDMNELGSIVEGISDGYEMMFVKKIIMSSNDMSDAQYIAFMYHEAMHAFQIEQYEEELFFSIPDDFEEQDILLLIDEIDEIAPLKALYEKEFDLLMQAVNDAVYVEDYLSARAARKDALKDYFTELEVRKILFLEGYYEKVEGTARYLESQVLFALEEEELYNQYIRMIGSYSDSKEKYYRSGFGLCLLLDGVSSDWKSEVFSFSGSLEELYKLKRD